MAILSEEKEHEAKILFGLWDNPGNYIFQINIYELPSLVKIYFYIFSLQRTD